jgi:hypothetical protein
MTTTSLSVCMPPDEPEAVMGASPWRDALVLHFGGAGSPVGRAHNDDNSLLVLENRARGGENASNSPVPSDWDKRGSMLQSRAASNLGLPANLGSLANIAAAAARKVDRSLLTTEELTNMGNLMCSEPASPGLPSLVQMFATGHQEDAAFHVENALSRHNSADSVPPEAAPRMSALSRSFSLASFASSTHDSVRRSLSGLNLSRLSPGSSRHSSRPSSRANSRASSLSDPVSRPASPEVRFVSSLSGPARFRWPSFRNPFNSVAA